MCVFSLPTVLARHALLVSSAGDDITSKQLKDDMMTLLIAGGWQQQRGWCWLDWRHRRGGQVLKRCGLCVCRKEGPRGHCPLPALAQLCDPLLASPVLAARPRDHRCCAHLDLPLHRRPARRHRAPARGGALPGRRGGGRRAAALRQGAAQARMHGSCGCAQHSPCLPLLPLLDHAPEVEACLASLFPCRWTRCWGTGGQGLRSCGRCATRPASSTSRCACTRSRRCSSGGYC